MPRNYTRKKGPVDQENIALAITAILNGQSVCSAAAQFKMNKSTLLRHLEAYRESGSRELNAGRKASLPYHIQLEISSVIKRASNCGYAFTKAEVRDFLGNYIKSVKDSDTADGAYLREHCQLGDPPNIYGIYQKIP